MFHGVGGLEIVTAQGVGKVPEFAGLTPPIPNEPIFIDNSLVSGKINIILM